MNKGTAPGTVGTTVTAPEVTSTIDEHTSEVTHRCTKLPIGAPAAPTRMVPLPDVPNRPCLRSDPLPLIPEFVLPFPLPGYISPLYSLVEADLRTDERPPLVRIQKPKALGEKPQSFAVVSGSSCSTSVSQSDVLPPIDHVKLREGLYLKLAQNCYNLISIIFFGCFVRSLPASSLIRCVPVINLVNCLQSDWLIDQQGVLLVPTAKSI